MSAVASESIPSQQVERILAQLDTLPPLAPVATRILALADDSKSGAKQIVTLIESDPSLTARMLSVLRRAEHGVRDEAISVENAVLMLGFETVRQLTLAVKVMEVFGQTGQPDTDDGFDRLEFWKHCLAVACAARHIAARIQSDVRPEEAFVLGLLHDIGKVALHTTMPKSFAKILRACDRTHADIADAERAVLGIDHAVIGRRLAERWGLPSRLAECIWLHHHGPEGLPASVAAGNHVQIVQLADTLVREHRIGFSGNRRVTIPSCELAKHLSLPEPERLAIVESLAEEIEARAAWIGAEQITSADVYLKALLRSTDELTQANAALADQNKRLGRKAEYFAALGWLNQSISPTASVREVCGIAAETLRRALSVGAVAVFVTSQDRRWANVGFSDGIVSDDVLERPSDAPDLDTDIAAAVQAAIAGTWLAPAGPAVDGVVGRYLDRPAGGPPLLSGEIFSSSEENCGTGAKAGGSRAGRPCHSLAADRSRARWLMPLMRKRRWVAGAVIAADENAVRRLRDEAAELEAIGAAVALAVSHALVRTAAVTLSDELAEANRRWSTTQAERLRAGALETIVAMAAGAAHELNNPLAVISGQAQLLRARAGESDVAEALGAISQKAAECSEIVTELMEFARPGPPSPEQIELKDLLGSLKTELISARLLDADALSVDVQSDTPPVVFDRRQLTELFRELIRNGVEATDPPTRRLTVKAAPDLTEEAVVLVVTDNGCGMTSEVVTRAMDPFFSMRPAGRGRGLGLARVHRWLQQGDATIRIESEPGEGTTIELHLPAARRSNT